MDYEAIVYKLITELTETSRRVAEARRKGNDHP